MIRDPDVPFFSRLRDQGGFALTEAIAAAAVLALLALGVLAGIDGAASSTGREKARATASSLAEQDQERLHSIPANNLPELRESQDIKVGGITYKVESEADWISDANGATVSCTSDGGKADYLRLRSTVTSRTVGRSTPPVVLESIVAPPIGSAGGNNGTLAVQVLDRDKVGVTNVTIGITGETSGHSATKQTNAVGCAVFAMIPGDTYSASINIPNWVDPIGVTAVKATGIVTPGGTTITSVDYDKRAQVTTAFDTLYYRYSGASPGWVTQASRAWALSFENSDVPGTGVRTFADTTAPVDPLTVHTGTNLFPFPDGHGIYAGRCTEQNPASTADQQAWAAINAHQVTNRNTDYDRRTGIAAPLRMPALPVRINRGTASSHAPYGNANVMARLVVPAPPPGEEPLCTDELQSQLQNTTWGLESYPNNRSMSGTGPAYTNGMTGFVTKIAGAGGTEFDPGVPFGKWRVCADDGTRSVVATIDNTKPDGPRNASNGWAYTTLRIPTSNETGSTGTCQTRAAW